MWFSQKYEKYYQENFPFDLLESAIIYDTFGGEMEIGKQKGLDRMIVMMVTKRVEEIGKVKVLDENIERFIQKVK